MIGIYGPSKAIWFPSKSWKSIFDSILINQDIDKQERVRIVNEIIELLLCAPLLQEIEDDLKRLGNRQLTQNRIDLTELISNTFESIIEGKNTSEILAAIHDCYFLDFYEFFSSETHKLEIKRCLSILIDHCPEDIKYYPRTINILEELTSIHLNFFALMSRDQGAVCYNPGYPQFYFHEFLTQGYFYVQSDKFCFDFSFPVDNPYGRINESKLSFEYDRIIEIISRDIFAYPSVHKILSLNKDLNLEWRFEKYHPYEKIKFGMHSGKLIYEVPPDYLLWLVQSKPEFILNEMYFVGFMSLYIDSDKSEIVNSIWYKLFATNRNKLFLLKLISSNRGIMEQWREKDNSRWHNDWTARDAFDDDDQYREWLNH